MVLRQLAAQVPAGLGQLRFLHGDPVAAVELTDEAHEQRIGEHPGLRFVEPQVLDPHPGLLEHLAVDGLLDRLADLVEARDEGIFFERPTAIAREQQPVAVVHRDNHSRADLRIDRVFAMRADHGALDRAFLHARAASATEFLGIIPTVQALARCGGEQGGADSSENDSAPAPTPAETFTAKIGDTEYETLDAAINAAQDGATIEIGENCTLTVGTIEKAVVINGNDKTISIPEQDTENHALNINASLTFNKATVEFPDAETSTHSWAFTMNREGKLTLDNGSTCIIKHQIIDACNDATINVLNGSVLKVLDAGWTAIHGADEKENVQYSFLNIKGGSTVEIDKAKSVNKEEDGEANGITSCKIDVENSTLTITNCENQGLVRCWLTLDNSNAEISGNDMGITGYADTNVLTMKNGATLLIKDNAHSGIFMYGGNVDVQDGTALTITGTGNSVSDEVVEGYYVGALAIRTAEPANANVKFADKATVNLIDNAVSAIRNCGTIEIGADTVITNNGSKTKYGGGCTNRGKVYGGCVDR